MSLATLSYEEFESGKVMGMRIHDLHHDIVVMKAGKRAVDWHERLLEGYNAIRGGDQPSCSGASRDWASNRFCDDKYFHSHVMRHLLCAGLHDEALKLVTNPQWTARQLEVSGLLQFEENVSAVKSVFSSEEAGSSDRESLLHGLQQVAGAARCSYGHGYASVAELYFQMCGRLIGEAQGSEIVQEYVSKIRTVTEGPWLRPTKACLTVPGGGRERFVSCRTGVSCMELVRDDVKVVCGCGDGRILAVDMAAGRIVNEWKAHDDRVACIAVTSDGKRVVSGGWDGTVKMWDAETGAQIGASVAGHEGRVTGVAIAAGGEWAVSGSADGTIGMWDVQNSNIGVRQRWEKQLGGIVCVTVSPDGRLIASGGEDGRVRVWSVETGEIKWTCSPGKRKIGKGDIEEFMLVSIVNDGKYVVSCLEDGTVTFWDLVSGQRDGDQIRIEKKLGTRRGDVSCDGNRIVLSGSEEICVLDTETREEFVRATVGTPSDWIADVKLSADGTKVLWCSFQGTLRSLDVASDAAASTEAPARGQSPSDVVAEHERGVWSVAVTPDEKHVVAAYRDGRVRVLDVHSGQPMGDLFEGHVGPVTGVALTPDGRRIVSVSDDKTVRVWDFESRQQISEFVGHERWINCVVVTSDGDRAVTGSRDHTVRVWKLSAGSRECVTLEGHTNDVMRVCVSGDGRRIISASWGNEVRVWDMETATCVKVVPCGDARYLPEKELLMAAGESVGPGGKGTQVRCNRRQICMGSTEAPFVLGAFEEDVLDWTYSPCEKMLFVVLWKGGSQEMFRFSVENEAKAND